MPWLPEQVDAVLRTLQEAGYSPYLVGGCVRELLRGKAPSDYDLTSDAPPQDVLRLFGAAAHPTGLAHGTVTVVRGGMPVEITTMRRDGAYHDSRHPDSVAFGASIEEDLARRDFTVNAIALSPGGKFVDPYGGRVDLNAGVLRCVGDARALLAHVACERVYTEMNKLLSGENVTQTLLAFPDILGVFIPEILPCVGFAQRNRHHCFDVWEHTARAVGAIPPMPALRWTMLFHDLGKPECLSVDEQGVGHFYGHTERSARIAETVMERLRFEKALRVQVRAQLECFDDMFPPERAAVHREMARRGREETGRLLLTKQADNAAKAPEGLERAQAPWREAQRVYDALIAENACCAVRELCVAGDELAALGWRGREIGAVLERLLEEVSAERLANTHEALFRRAQRLWRSGFARRTIEKNDEQNDPEVKNGEHDGLS